MFCQHAAAERIDLAKCNGFKSSSALKAQTEAADTTE